MKQERQAPEQNTVQLNELINSILRSDATVAKRLTEEAQREQETADQRLEAQKAALHQKYEALTASRIEKVRQAEQKAAEERLRDIGRTKQEKLAAIEDEAAKRSKDWVEEIYTRVIRH